MKKFTILILYYRLFFFRQDPNQGALNEKIFPPTPMASSLRKYGETPVSYYTGSSLQNFVYIIFKNI